MKIDEAREKFIHSWGTLSKEWGISKTTAKVHALLLISPEALNADEIMSTLKISRGNANMTTRDLMKWGLVIKELRAGERKEYFRAEKDMWKVFVNIARERRKNELEPLIRLLLEMRQLEGDNKNKETRIFREVTDGIYEVASRADKVLDMVSRSDQSWFMSAFFKLIK